MIPAVYLQGLGKTVSTIALIVSNPSPNMRETRQLAGLSRDSGEQPISGDSNSNDADAVSMDSTTSGRTDDSIGPAYSEPEATPGLSASDTDEQDSLAASDDEQETAGTLIVCPTSVLQQWHRELTDKVAAAAGKAS